MIALQRQMPSMARMWTRALSTCNCNKNQTAKEVFDYLRVNKEKGPMLKGTGIFLVPAPEKGILEEKAVLVEDLTYAEAVKRGENCLAMKWIPLALKTISQVQDERSKCSGTYYGPDHEWCPGGCISGSGNNCR